MSGAGDSVPLFSTEELAQARTAAEEIQREFNEWAAQLQTPAAKAEAAIQAQEVAEMWEAFDRDCKAGKYTLSTDELAQLRQDAEEFAEKVKAGKYNLSPDEMKELFDRGRLVKCHPIKRGGSSE